MDMPEDKIRKVSEDRKGTDLVEPDRRRRGFAPGDFIETPTSSPRSRRRPTPTSPRPYSCSPASPAREAKVLRMRFGIDEHRPPLEEVGKQFDVTRERIRQIEAKALRKLRHPGRSVPAQLPRHRDVLPSPACGDSAKRPPVLWSGADEGRLRRTKARRMAARSIANRRRMAQLNG